MASPRRRPDRFPDMKNTFSYLLLTLVLLGGLAAEPAGASVDWLTDTSAESRLDSSDGADGAKDLVAGMFWAAPSFILVASHGPDTVFLARESLHGTRDRVFDRTWRKTGPPTSPRQSV